MNEQGKIVHHRIFPVDHRDDLFWQAWDALNQQLYSGHPLLDARFVRRLVKYFSHSVYAFQIDMDGHTEAIILVNKGRLLSMDGFHPGQSQISLSLVSPQCTAAIFVRCLKEITTYKRLDLYSIDPENHLSLASINPYTIQQRASVNVIIGLDGNFEDYWRMRPKKVRNNVTRYLSRARKDYANVHMEVYREQYAVSAAVGRYGILESSGWKGKHGTALHPANSQGEFYREVMEEFASTLQGIVFELYFDDRLVASRLSIHSDNKLVMIKTAYDEEIRQYAPGKILLYLVLEQLFTEKSVHHVDFYTDATEEQQRWATGCRQLLNISVCPTEMVRGAWQSYYSVKESVTGLAND